MDSILTSEFFKEFAIPFVSVAVTLMLKMNSRPDVSFSLNRDDFSIGFDLCVNSVIIIIFYMSDVALKIKKGTATIEEKTIISSLPWTLLAIFVGMSCLAMIIRKVGWEQVQTQVKPQQKKWSIVVSVICGIITLLIAIRLTK